MRHLVDAARLQRFLVELGKRAKGTGAVYLVGGSSAVLEGWRSTTIDIDLKLDPEPAGVFGAIAALKEELQVSIELAAPDDFIPELPGWRDRSVWIGKFGLVEVRHYDFYAQALSKIERGHAKDLLDVSHMLDSGLVEPVRLRALFRAIEPELERFPGIDARDYAARVEAFLTNHLR